MGVLDALRGVVGSKEDLDALMTRLANVGTNSSLKNAFGNTKLATQIARYGEVAIPPLSRLIEQRGVSQEAKQTAALALANLGEPAHHVLIGMLQHPDDQNTRLASGLAMCQSKPPMFSTLITAFDHPNPQVRFDAAFPLAQMGQTGRSVLVATLDEANLDVSATAAYGLGLMGGDALRQATLGLPINPSTPISSDDLPMLSDWLDDLESDHERRRWQAAFDLGNVGSSTAIPFLLKALKEERHTLTRAMEMWALWRISWAGLKRT